MSTVPCRQKRSASRIQVLCSDDIKIYNKGMGGIALIDQRAAAYHVDRKSIIKLYLCIFFDLMDVACAKSYIVAYDASKIEIKLFSFLRYTCRHGVFYIFIFTL